MFHPLDHFCASVDSLFQHSLTNLWLIIQENHCLRYKLLVGCCQRIPEQPQLRQLSTVSAQPESTHSTRDFFPDENFAPSLEMTDAKKLKIRQHRSEVFTPFPSVYGPVPIFAVPNASSDSVPDKPNSERQICIV
jgi:hypothetical protein